jgi:hypothetical protein
MAARFPGANNVPPSATDLHWNTGKETLQPQHTATNKITPTTTASQSLESYHRNGRE